MMGGYGFGGLFGIAGILLGAVVIISSVMLYSHPAEHSRWGLIIVVFSALSLLGGSLVGLILGVLGGIFAITWKSPTVPKA
jgi:hypothetical protein